MYIKAGGFCLKCSIIMCGMNIAVCLVAFFACCYAAPNKYIWNGEDVTEITKYPYQVSVQWADFGSVYHICGGAIIDKNYVITANHCCNEKYEGKLYVVAGEVNIKIEKPDDKKLIKVTKMDPVQIPANPENDIKVDDICLLKVDTDLETKGKIIPLFLEPLLEEPQKYTLTGWGYFDPTNQIASTLKKNSDLTILPRKEQTPDVDTFEDHVNSTKWNRVYADEDKNTCEYVLTELGFSAGLLQDNQICTKGNLHTTCNGDSGGPLVYENPESTNPDHKFELVGVVSWGIAACDRDGIPNIYTNVAPYKEAIDDLMR